MFMFLLSEEYLWFQVQFIEIQINENAISTIQTHRIQTTQRASSRQRHAKVTGTPEHDHQKQQMKNTNQYSQYS